MEQLRTIEKNPIIGSLPVFSNSTTFNIMKMYCPNKKNDSHLTLVDYGDDKFKLRIQRKGNTGTYTSLDSCSFQSVASVLYIYQIPIKNKTKTFFQQNTFLNETDLYQDDDLVGKRIPQKNSPSQSFCIIHTLFPEVQYEYFNDSHFP